MVSCNVRASFVVAVWLIINVIYSFKLNSCSANKSRSVLCSETERNTLLRFKEYLDVASDCLVSWTHLQPDCCKWDEIVCHNITGHVKELHLQNLNFSYSKHRISPVLSKAEINSCLLELKYLEYLDLSFNLFGDIPIPSFFGSMVSLTYLNLSQAGFDGLVPHQLGNLSNLHYLSLGYNSLFVDNLYWLKNLSSLVHLDFNNVDMSATSHEWLGIMNSLPFLLELHLSDSQLAFIPSWHSVNFTSLSVLDVSNNLFENATIPKWTMSLHELKILDLSKSGFTGPIPNGMSNLSSLSILNLADNSLTSLSPDWLFGLKRLTSFCNLEMIDLSNNRFTGEIFKALESISGCESSNLREIYVDNNKFSGSFPDNFHIFSALTIFQLPFNQIVGNIPESLGTLSNLQKLNIEHNMLEGIISEVHFRNLTNFRFLAASNNNLTLKVDSSWVPPFHLDFLELSHWSIGPQFPLWLQTQHELGVLDLSCAGISDTIPSWFWNFSSESIYFNLSHNQIYGQLPTRIEHKTQYLMDLSIYLSSNKLTGSLPQISGDIIELDLSNNSLSGSMSVLLCNPIDEETTLTILNLGGNNLSGEIPDCWDYWGSLEVINLENNHLTGNIPNSISYLTDLRSLHLRNNNLSGKIPSSLQDCPRLNVLDLGFNSFDGKLPPWLGSFDDLLVLALPSNNLKGKIPANFCNLSSLQVLDISANNLSGSIPKCINNLESMTTVLNYTIFFQIGYQNSFVENAYVVIKGREYLYDSILPLLTSIDLSMNKLSGGIPSQMTTLLGLRSLNLSGNKLTGEIPSNIGVMQVLESFDLSRNQISGNIPQSMSSMYFLSYLNMSCNNLSGEIPQSTQLQSFNSSSFIGNRLCGPPLALNCRVRHKPKMVGKESEHKNGGTKVEGFYMAMVLGFLVGFWGICGPILYSRSWRIAYYRLLHSVWSRLCDMFFIKTIHLYRRG